MLVVLIGDNEFAIARGVKKLRSDFSGEVERLDGEALTRNGLADAISGATLFSSQRLVIIKNLHQNSELWSEAVPFFERVGDDTYLVLIESGVDKRSKVYKWLQKHADVQEHTNWAPRDLDLARRWLIDEAKLLGLDLSVEQAKRIVARTGLDQGRVYQALEKLVLVDDITDETIDATVEQSPFENVFALLETAMKETPEKLLQSLETLRTIEDPYKIFGLLASQIMQVTVLAVSNDPPATVAKELGVHPFVLSRLAPLARKLGDVHAKRLLDVTARMDVAMKTTSTDPWILVERVLREAQQLAISL